MLAPSLVLPVVQPSPAIRRRGRYIRRRSGHHSGRYSKAVPHIVAGTEPGQWLPSDSTQRPAVGGDSSATPTSLATAPSLFRPAARPRQTMVWKVRMVWRRWWCGRRRWRRYCRRRRWRRYCRRRRWRSCRRRRRWRLEFADTVGCQSHPSWTPTIGTGKGGAPKVSLVVESWTGRP